MKNKIINTLLLSIFVFVTTGCHKFSTIKIEQKDKHLAFNFSEIGETKNSQYILYDIAVSRNNCTAENCVYWEIVRDQAYFDSFQYSLHSNTILYGSKPDAMKVTTPPKPLSSGEYSVAASVSIMENYKLMKSVKIFQNFKLTISNNKDLYIE